MSGQIENLYKLQKKDISKAGVVLADAFQHDPIWANIFEVESKNINRMGAWFEGSVRYGLRYGEVYAPSKNLEGIAVWGLNDFADMTMWRMIRSGSIFSGMKLGLKTISRAMKMKTVFEPLEADRKANMQGRDYIYLMIIGVASKFQGQGFGGKLLRALIAESERAGLPIYLETETERNVSMY
jgi:GNAT superfamily N-acetyltransferase